MTEIKRTEKEHIINGHFYVAETIETYETMPSGVVISSIRVKSPNPEDVRDLGTCRTHCHGYYSCTSCYNYIK